jgi:hypothetical protein
MLFFFETKVLLLITLLNIGDTLQISMPFERDDYNFRADALPVKDTRLLTENPLIFEVMSILYFSSSASSMASSRMEGLSLFWICTIGGYLYSSVSRLTRSNFFSFRNRESSFSKRCLGSSLIFPLNLRELFRWWSWASHREGANVVAVFPN